MSDDIKEILFSILGTFGFSIIMKVPRNFLIYTVIGSAVTASFDTLLSDKCSVFFACFFAMVLLIFYCEIIARIKKTPSTVILMPSTIPLLPGSSIYYTMLCFVRQDTDGFISYGKTTLFTGMGIALGAVVGSIIVKLITTHSLKNKNDKT